MLIACVLVKLLPFNFMPRINNFEDYPFPLPHMDFLKMFFTSEDKILETTSCQVFTIT